MFDRGDKVRLIRDHRELRFPEVIRAGETGVLGQRYRVQDGIEVWQMFLDVKRKFQGRSISVSIAVDHVNIEKL